MNTIFENIRAALTRAIDQTGMYRVVTLALFGLAFVSFIWAFFGWIAFNPLSLLLSASFAVLFALALNMSASKVLRVEANHESAVITALILFFLFVPPSSAISWGWYALAIAIGILSKFILVWKKQHFVNAAALGAAAVSFPYFMEAYWWIGTPSLFIPLLIAGSIVVFKIRKWELVLSFIGVAFLTLLIGETWRGQDPFLVSTAFFLSWPALFLAFFMLTEPFTMPGTKKLQIFYGAFVGFLSTTTIFSSFVAMTPELALVIANILFFPATLTQKLFLRLKEKKEIASDTYEFVFEKPEGMQFMAGQYLEWMLPHEKSDTRGKRRYFTIASAPEEGVLRVALRIQKEKGSSYKKALMDLPIGGMVIASQRAGDFILPENKNEKLAFIGGGIGVTPFISHTSHMHLTHAWHDTILFYANKKESDIAYREEFDAYAKYAPFQIVHVLSDEKKEGFEHGFLNEEMVTRYAPDFKNRTWYLSGPPGMVKAYRALLTKMGVRGHQIKEDFFPGLA